MLVDKQLKQDIYFKVKTRPYFKVTKRSKIKAYLFIQKIKRGKYKFTTKFKDIYTK